MLCSHTPTQLLASAARSAVRTLPSIPLLAHAFKALPFISCNILCVSPSLSPISLFYFKEQLLPHHVASAANPPSLNEHLSASVFVRPHATPELEHLAEQPPEAATTGSAADFLLARTGAPVEGDRSAQSLSVR